MAGYIGERARRKKRNTILFFILIGVIAIIFYFEPALKLKETMPSDTLLPSEDEIQSPKLNSTIEELKLKIFDKEQKIIFRNKQIDNLKEEIRILSIQNQKLKKSFTQAKDDLDTSFKDNKANVRIKKEFQENIQNINKKMNQISKEKENLFKDNILLKEMINNIKAENKTFAQEYKNLKNKNLNLKNSHDYLENKILELEVLIEEQNLIIKVLQDTSHHN